MKRLVLVLFILMALASPAFADDTAQAAYDRVMKTQTIRCGYGVNPPWIYKDLQSGEIKGVIADVMRAVADDLGLTLVWPEETGWGELPTAVNAGKYDVACSTLWTEPKRGKVVAFTTPIFYTGLYAYARADDTRFKHGLADINKADIKIVTAEGDFSTYLANRYAPAATKVTLPPSSDDATLFMNVTSKKADIVVHNATSVALYNEKNDSKLVKVPLNTPLTVYGFSFAVGVRESALQNVIDNAVRHLIMTGKMDELTADFRKQYPGAILLPASPFTTGQ